LSRPVLIHPGFHKTGTTYLQEVLFADTRTFQQPWPRDFLYQHVIDPHELAFSAKNTRKSFDELTSTASASTIPVLSEEGLCGNPFNGAREAGILARKLRAIFDDARILLTVRSQPGMLRAVYIQYLKAYGRRSPETFFSPPRFPEFSAFDPDIYKYDRLAALYAELFGAENVLVLPQELLQRDEKNFLRAVGKLVGSEMAVTPPDHAGNEDRNVSPSPSGVPFLRFGNHFSSSAFNESGLGRSLGGLASAFRSIGYRKTPFFGNKPDEFRRLIDQFQGYYAQSNARLQAFCPVELSTLGYEVS